jgi:hypothetical protein
MGGALNVRRGKNGELGAVVKSMSFDATTPLYVIKDGSMDLGVALGLCSKVGAPKPHNHNIKAEMHACSRGK